MAFCYRTRKYCRFKVMWMIRGFLGGLKFMILGFWGKTIFFSGRRGPRFKLGFLSGGWGA